jgi:hypothetical protein
LTLTRPRPSCLRSWTRRSSRQGRRCGFGHRTGGHYTPGPKLHTRCAGWSSLGLYQAFTLGGRQIVVPSCIRSSRGVVARPVSILVSIGVAVPSGRGRLRRSGPPRPGPIGWPGTARLMQAPSGTASYLSVTCALAVVHTSVQEHHRGRWEPLNLRHGHLYTTLTM